MGAIKREPYWQKRRFNELRHMTWLVVFLWRRELKELDLYYIDLKYIRDLSSVDDNIMSISPQRGKQGRPFVGVIVLMNQRKYCIPLTSPKEKFKSMKSQVDFLKIFDEKVIRKVDLTIHSKDKPETKAYKQLMQKQLKWCRTHADTIENMFALF